MSTAAVGPGALVRWGRWRSCWHAVVRRGGRLEHYRRRTDRPDRPWAFVAEVSDSVTGPGQFFVMDDTLCVQVGKAEGRASYRLHGDHWEPFDAAASARVVTQESHHEGLPVGAAVAGAGLRAWSEAIADEDGSVFGYHRRPDGRWVRESCLFVHDPQFDTAANTSIKLAQISGERDATPTPWGERPPTLSSSESTAGVRATDLGVRFEHRGRSFLLFGDTHWCRPWLALRDAIAEVIPDADAGLPAVRFHGSPLRLRGRGATMGEYDVPLDAISLSGDVFGFFSSNHGRGRQVMGRSVLARCLDPELAIEPGRRHRPIRFATVATLSERHFINVSAQLRPADVVPGCDGVGEVLLLWGTGAYRASEIRLAMLDQQALARLSTLHRAVSTEALGLRYWDGAGWISDEDRAAPIFRPGAYGELSVRWVPQNRRYALLTATGPGDPAGSAITLRWADQPTGPWTSRLRLFDWVAGGMATDPFTRFIKAGPDDPVGEPTFAAQARGNGAAYAPYVFDARRDGDVLVLRYTLSTWNPYQVVLMEHRLVPGEY